ncbi:nitroreductase family protein [Streptomyces sp. NPDC058985]|uniref:nitroreductase family protein n=1 Tax=Streptomyces sp. NPDC058985 TaxID=3346684 RepID=UPI00368C2754
MTHLRLGQRANRGLPPHNRRHGFLKRTKLRLQFTGWLQYIPTAAAAVLLLAAALAGSWIGIWQVLLVRLPLGIGILLLGALLVDLVTLKLGVRPFEPVPRRLDELDTFGVMHKRRSCRSFQNRDLTVSDREELMRAVHRHTRPTHLIGTRPIRLEYVAAPLKVWPTVGAREFIVAVAPRTYDRLSVIDVGRSLHKVVLHATRMGVATCWIGAGADQTSVVSHLGGRFDPAEEHVICVCAVGYRSRFKPIVVRAIELVQHRRLPLASLFFASPSFDTPLKVDRPPFSPFRRCYEACRWSPSSLNTQTTRCIGTTDDSGRAMARFDFCTTTASRYYAPLGLGIWCANWEVGCEALGLPGHLRVLTSDEQGELDTPEPPGYGVSWIADPLGASTA